MLSDGSDLEEITPLNISNNSATYAEEIPLQPPPLPLPATSELEDEELPLLATSDLEDEEVQVIWDFTTDCSHAAKVAEALHKLVRAQH